MTRMASLEVLANFDPNVLVPPRPAGVKDQRNLPLFEAHPLQHAYRSRHSQLQLPVEFHAYSADNTTIVCLANRDKVAAFLEPIGYEPMVVRVGADDAKRYGLKADKDYAIVNLVMNDYADTSAGPYKALPLSLFALQSDESDNNGANPALKDPTAALLPLLDPHVAMIMGPLAMSKNQAAFDVGRDVMGIDKFVADVRIDHDQDGTTSSIVVNGRKLLDARVSDGSPEELLDAQARLFSELGIFQSFKLLLGKNEPMEHPFIGWNGSESTYDKDRLPPAYCRSYTLNSPAFKLWNGNDRLDFTPGCALTDRLAEFECRPILTSRDKLVSVAVELDDSQTEVVRKRQQQPRKQPPAVTKTTHR